MRKMEETLVKLIHFARCVGKAFQEILSGPGSMGRLVP